MNGRRICTPCSQVFWRVCKRRCLGRVCNQNLSCTASFPSWGWGTACVSLPSLCGVVWPWLRTGWPQGTTGLPHLSVFSTWPLTWWAASLAVSDPHTPCQAWHFCEITHRSACILSPKLYPEAGTVLGLQRLSNWWGVYLFPSMTKLFGGRLRIF